MNRHLFLPSQMKIFHMFKLYLDMPYFNRMEYMQEYIIKITQTTIRYTSVSFFFFNTDESRFCTNLYKYNP